MNRYTITQLHMLLAGFLLPMAIVYFIGGGLYTADIKGSVDKQKITLSLEQPFKPDIDLLSQITKQALVERQLPLPDGEPTLKKQKGVYALRWSDLPYSVELTGRRHEHVATLVYRKRSFLTQMMRIHRAEAGTGLRVLSLLMAGGLIIIFASGIYMAQSIPRFRKPLFISIASGVLGFLALVVI